LNTLISRLSVNSAAIEYNQDARVIRRITQRDPANSDATNATRRRRQMPPIGALANAQ
jgi:hypothetical protein